MYYTGARPCSRCARLFTCALTRSKVSLPRQVIGCCLHCLWHTPPPLLDTSVVFIRAEELGATLLSNLQSQAVHSASSSLRSWISAQRWENQKFNLNRCSNSNVNGLRLHLKMFRPSDARLVLNSFKKRCHGSRFICLLLLFFLIS